MASEEPSPDLAYLLSRAERQLTRRVAVVLAEEGCTVEQWRVLAAVAGASGRPMTETAEDAMLPAPSLTKLVDRMVADNLVHRRADPSDRRRVLLHLAPRGRILHERAAHRLAEAQAAFLSAPPPDLVALANVLLAGSPSPTTAPRR
jgi:DNA-binding MarR family transcriptional regulator